MPIGTKSNHQIQSSPLSPGPLSPSPLSAASACSPKTVMSPEADVVVVADADPAASVVVVGVKPPDGIVVGEVGAGNVVAGGTDAGGAALEPTRNTVPPSAERLGVLVASKITMRVPDVALVGTTTYEFVTAVLPTTE